MTNCRATFSPFRALRRLGLGSSDCVSAGGHPHGEKAALASVGMAGPPAVLVGEKFFFR